MRIMAAITLSAMLTGCTRHRIQTVIPAKCMHIKVTDFGQPCVEQKDGSLLCDKVRVSTSCAQYSSTSTAN